MNLSDSHSGSPVAFADDELLRLEFQVAQRADELSHRDGCERGRDLEHWLQAEREILEVIGEDSASVRPI